MAASNRAERRAAQRKWKVDEFREQAFESKGTLSHMELEVGEGDEAETFLIPNPAALDDDTQERVEVFQRGEGLDRITIHGEDGAPLKGVDGEPVTRIKEPHQIDGVKLPAVSIRSAQAILGVEDHARFIAKGGRSSDITQAWEYMVEQVKARQGADPN